MTLTGSGTSIIDLMVSDHRRIGQLLGRFETVPEHERDGYFCEVVHELVRHEIAEEQVAYPALRADSPGGGTEADARIDEQSRAEVLLARMERMDTSSAEFASLFVQLRNAVLRHAEAEESVAFPMLADAEDRPKLTALGRRYESARASAPTHPHPHAPDTPPKSSVVGPITALVDRFRDAMRGQGR